jgi:hypothetical protein
MSIRHPQPAPDPPTKGFWIDPENPTKIRYYTGKRWAPGSYDRDIWEAKAPEGQGLFVLGAGKDGIATGLPLAERKGRYLSKVGTWIGILAVCGAFAALWLGINHDIPALGWSGAALILGMFGFFAVTAWRAGLRPPGFGQGVSIGVRIFFYWWACLVTGAALGSWIAPALDSDSVAYEWCNRVGMILLDGAVVAFGLLCFYGVWKEGRRPGNFGYACLAAVLGVGLPALFLWRTWDRLQDALWLQ